MMMQQESTDIALQPNRSLKLYLALYSGFWVIAAWLIFLISEYWQIDSMGKIFSFYPSDAPGSVSLTCLPDPIGLHFFGDFVSVVCHSHLGSPYLDTSTNYFPVAYLLMKSFYPLMQLSLWIGIGTFYISGAFLLVYLVNKSLKSSMGIFEIGSVVFIIVGTAQPVISLIDRGNLQVVVTLLVLFAAVEMSKTSEGKRYDPLAIGIATALKGYPLIFAFRYFKTREYKRFSLTVFIAAGSTLLALTTFRGGIFANFTPMKDAILGFRGGGKNWLRYNVSLKGMLYSIQHENLLGFGRVAEWAVNHYLHVIVVLACVAVLVLIRLPLGLSEQFLLGAVFCGLLVDYTSSYVLTLFLVPLVLLLKDDSFTRLNICYLVVIALLMIPKGVSFSNDPENHANSISTTFSDHMPSFASIVNPFLMLLLGMIIVTTALMRHESTI